MPTFKNDVTDGEDAIFGQSATGRGVVGVAPSASSGVEGNSTSGAGVFGASGSGRGVVGVADAATGVEGNSTSGDGVFGSSKSGRGVVGVADAATGVEGNSTSGAGIFGTSKSGRGVVGVADAATGVEGNSTSGAGVWGESTNGEGVHGVSHSAGAAAVHGVNTADKGTAGFFDGNVVVTGDVILQGADYAEALTTTDVEVKPGMVVVLGDDGEIHPCAEEYDTRVAGIVSGAGGVKPALVLDRHENSAHVALMGKVWCYADADHAEIRPGDLLTTSSTIGHCQRVTNTAEAFGTVIGKALTPLADGLGLVRVLVSPR